MTAIITIRAFGGPLDGADVSVPVDPNGWPPPYVWVNRTQADYVSWPGVPDPQPLAGPLWSKYVVAPDPEHPDDRQPWRYNFVRSQDQDPSFPVDWIDG